MSGADVPITIETEVKIPKYCITYPAMKTDVKSLIKYSLNERMEMVYPSISGGITE